LIEWISSLVRLSGSFSDVVEARDLITYTINSVTLEKPVPSMSCWRLS